MDPLQTAFDGAVWYVSTKDADRNPRVGLSAAQKLELYGLFKVATAGPLCPNRTPSQPGLDLNGDAWQAASGLTKEEAMAGYVELLHVTEPDWRAKAAACGCPTLVAASSIGAEVWSPRATKATQAKDPGEPEADAVFSPSAPNSQRSSHVI